MSVNEILEELEQLSPDELILIQGKLETLRQDVVESPDMTAFVEEGIHSAEEGPLVSLDHVIQEIRLWNSKSS